MKSYNQYCGIAKALDVVGARWTLLLIRELLPGPRRFTDLLLPGLTRNLLSDRLAQLKRDGLIARVPDGGRHAYALTERGRALEPALLALGGWGSGELGLPQGEHISPRWLIVSLQRRYGGPLEARVQLEIDGQPFQLHIRGGRLTSRDGRTVDPDLEIRGTMAQVGAVLGALQTPPLGLVIRGDRSVLEALLEGLG